MKSEYDPLLSSPAAAEDDELERVQERFALAARPYFASPWSWWTWSVLLPGAAWATPRVLASFSGPGVLLLWSSIILIGGLVEAGPMLRRRGGPAASVARWALHVQGNLSVVAAALTVTLVWIGQAWLLPALWLLLLGHSFYVLGSLAFAPMRRCGLCYELAGLAALWPRLHPLLLWAIATGVGNFGVGFAVWRRRRADAGPSGARRA